MNTNTNTTPAAVNRVLDTVRGAAFLPAVGDVIDTRSAQWAAVGTAVGIEPGLYAVEAHSVKTPGKNYGKPTVRLVSADRDTLTAQRTAAAERVAQWQDPAWIDAQRADAESRLADIDARIARLAPATVAPAPAPAATPDVAAILADPAALAAILAALTAGQA